MNGRSFNLAIHSLILTPKGGENMNLLTKLARNKMVVGIILSFVFGILLLPAVPVYSENDIQLGIIYSKDTGLGTQDVRSTVSQIIKVALGLLGIVALVLILAAGFKWMTAGGNEEKVGEAKKLMMQAVIGLAIIFASYAIAQFVLTQLYKATTGTDYDITEGVPPT